MKPIFKIVIVILVLLTVGAVIYFGWRWMTRKAPVTQAPANTGLSTTTGVRVGAPPAQQAQGGSVAVATSGAVLSAVSDTPVFYFWTVPGTKSIYYMARDGKVFQAKDGADQSVSSQTLDNIRGAEAVNGGGKVLASFGDRTNLQWAIFDVIDSVWRPLPQDISLATWGKDDNEVIALKKNGNDTNLISINLAKNPVSISIIIKNFGFKDVLLTWRPPNFLMVAEKPSLSYNSRVWQLDLKKLTLENVFVGMSGQMIEWSPDRRVAARFAAPGDFSLLDSKLQESAAIFFSTLPGKCALDSIKTYCFVPKDVPEKINLPDDYLENKFRSADVVYEVNFVTDDVGQIFTSGAGDVPAIDGWRSAYLDGALYFINRFDGLLYRLSVR